MLKGAGLFVVGVSGGTRRREKTLLIINICGEADSFSELPPMMSAGDLFGGIAGHYPICGDKGFHRQL